MSREPELLLLGRPDCHLCHEMRAVVERALEGRGIAVVERSIEDDEEWLRRYALLIPVLLWGEREIARYAVEEAELRRRLEAVLPAAPSP